jgi:chromosome segregation ATPase
MDHSSDPGGRLDAKNPLTKWVDEMQGVMKMITSLIEDSDRHRAGAESAQREHAELREQLDRMRAEMDSQRSEAECLREEIERHRAEAERQRAAVESGQRERDDLHAEIAALHAENERLRNDQTEAGETAAKLLGEMKDLVNQVAHKFQGPSKTSPFAREPRSPQP